jgi:site-specific DNA-methyltransferase (adenine-specific)
MTHQLHHGDCLEVLRSMPDCSVDSIVTDPPYGLSFMGKKWDYDVPSVDVWVECLRVLKPGGHLLAFAGTRTQHRMAVRIEDAGFEIRDMIAWVYGSGFPKSYDVSKAIDKAAGAEREVVSNNPTFRKMQENASNYNLQRNEFITAPATPEAKQWQGWGTALKPALEPITVARKPLIGTVAENVLQHGTGAINVDGGRVGTEGGTKHNDGEKGKTKNCYGNGLFVEFGKPVSGLGRWPANFIHDGSEEATDLLGASARFFYCAKASKADRDEGCDKLQERSAGECVDRVEGSAGMESPRAGAGRTSGSRNHHPTVKPTDLMRYLCRLVTPPSGIVLDPFNGSGSTGCAAVLEGFQYIGIEREADYIAISEKRIQARSKQVQEQPKQLTLL